MTIIRELAQSFGAGKTDFLSRNCWAGYREIAFPVPVHEHLAAVVMTGQFPTSEAPHEAAAFLNKESEWRKTHSSMSSDALLLGHKEELQNAISQVSSSDSAIPGLPAGSDLEQELRVDVKQLTLLAEDRYLHNRYLSESAFRHELSGTLTNALLSGRPLAEVLQPVLARMRSFWAFRRACLLMGTDSENYVRLYASDTSYFGTDEPRKIQHAFGRELGTRSVYLILNSSKPLHKNQVLWKRFIKGVGRYYPELAPDRHTQSFGAIVRTGNRLYIFNFFDRELAGLSTLPFKPHPAVSIDNPLPEARLSEECREQVLRTCQNVAERFHQFWATYDQEQGYRVLSHTLRSPVSQMRRGSGKVRYLLRQDTQHRIQANHPEFVAALQELLTSLKLGAKVVNGELSKLGAVAKMEDILEKAKSGSCDICEVLRNVFREYEWRGTVKAAGTTPVTWQQTIPSEEHRVVGESEVIDLAVRNVVDNAFKYTYPGRCISISLHLAGSTRSVVVRNQGVPIEPDEMERVWQKNYRGINVLKRDVKGEEGTGFGLFLAKTIVEASGGKVALECVPLKSLKRKEAEVTVMLHFQGILG